MKSYLDQRKWKCFKTSSYNLVYIQAYDQIYYPWILKNIAVADMSNIFIVMVWNLSGEQIQECLLIIFINTQWTTIWFGSLAKLLQSKVKENILKLVV